MFPSAILMSCGIENNTEIANETVINYILILLMLRLVSASLQTLEKVAR